MESRGEFRWKTVAPTVDSGVSVLAVIRLSSCQRFGRCAGLTLLRLEHIHHAPDVADRFSQAGKRIFGLFFVLERHVPA